jgi:hypothetical protein
MNGPLENAMQHRVLRVGRVLRALAAAAACVLSLAGCGNDDEAPNVIRPLIATGTVTSGSAGDPLIYLEEVSETGDLVVVNVRLRNSSATQFQSFNLEVIFDATVVTIGAIGYENTLLCACNSSDSSCLSAVEPACVPSITMTMVPPDPPAYAGRSRFLLGVSALTGSGSPLFDTGTSTDVILVTLGFQAAAETTGTEILFPVDTTQPDGSCEILDDAGNDLMIPCDLGLVLTAQR